MKRVLRARTMIGFGWAVALAESIRHAQSYDFEEFLMQELAVYLAIGLLATGPLFFKLPRLERGRDYVGYLAWTAPSIVYMAVWILLISPLRVIGAFALAPSIVVGLSGWLRRPRDPTAEAF